MVVKRFFPFFDKFFLTKNVLITPSLFINFMIFCLQIFLFLFILIAIAAIVNSIWEADQGDVSMKNLNTRNGKFEKLI